MNYAEKYLKYKKKYIDLKNIKGGNFITFEADENKYKIDNNKTGLFNGELFIDGIGITKILYKGKWDNIKQGYHYFGLFKTIKKSKIIKEYEIDCVGEFNKEDKNIIFSGIYSDKITNKDFLNYINIPFNGYKPDNGEYKPINELIHDEKYIDARGDIFEPYSKKTLFYQEGWYYLNYGQQYIFNPIINGYNVYHDEKINYIKDIKDDTLKFIKFLNNLYLKYKNVNEKIKKIIEKYIDNHNNLEINEWLYFVSHCLQINILIINATEYNVESLKKFNYDHKIYSESNKYFNKKTITLYCKNNNFYTIFHNDDVVIYNLITDLEYQERIKNCESEIMYKHFGIINFQGASCYLHASLQLLLHCPPFLKYLNEVKKINEKNKFYKLNRGTDIIFNNGNISKDFYNNKNNIDKIIIASKLTCGKQEDSNDFFLNIFNILIENNILYDDCKINVDFTKIHLKKKYKKCYNIIYKNINNPINNIFKHYIGSYIYCGNQLNSIKYDEQIILSLELIKKYDKYDFDLESYFKKEELLDDNSLEECKKKNEVTYKQIKLYYLSEIFIIQLKRFYTESKHIKYDKHTHTDRKKYPIYKLLSGKYIRLEKDEAIDENNAWIWDFKKIKINDALNNIPKNINFENYIDIDYGYNNSTEYELIGYNVHQGSINGGHYVAYSYIKKENSWYYYNDSICNSNISGTLELNKAYFLMYQRISKNI